MKNNDLATFQQLNYCLVIATINLQNIDSKQVVE